MIFFIFPILKIFLLFGFLGLVICVMQRSEFISKIYTIMYTLFPLKVKFLETVNMEKFSFYFRFFVYWPFSTRAESVGPIRTLYQNKTVLAKFPLFLLGGYASVFIEARSDFPAD